MYRAKLTTNMRSLTFRYDSDTAEGKGVHRFIKDNYADYKTLNPKFHFLIREFKDCPPVLTAQYDGTEEESRDLAFANSEQIEKTLRELIELGEYKPRTRQSEAHWLDMATEEDQYTEDNPMPLSHYEV
eukprot:gb/GECH01012080.1/.p1 GENE.gb/GECH01012080.1/~~gb/GECH01012080.1/.p1  ORF type:complete len:129 (+),score=29.08 gb/GECH01012080.1/:1-387(+)